MPNRSEIQAFLRANGFEAQANDQASLVFAEGLIEVLGEVTPGMIEAGGTAKGAIEIDGDAEVTFYPATIYRAMWAARFRGE